MNRLFLLGLGLTFVLPLTTPTDVSADVLCRQGNKLKIRDNKCKAKKDEVQVLPEDIGLEGEQGPPGEPGAPGSARAWASVNPGQNPSFVDALGFDSVRDGSGAVDGVYCLTLSDDGIDPEGTAPVASVNLTLTETSAISLDVLVVVRPSAFVCNDDEIEVLTMRVNHDTVPSETDLVGNVGFNIVVP